MTLRNVIPWQAKMIAKMFLARLPFPYALWRRVHIFRDGAMDDLEYARSVMAERTKLPDGGFPYPGIWLELGPGDSLVSALLAHLMGAKRVILVDSAAHARTDVAWYRAVATTLDPSHRRLRPARWTRIDDVLGDLGAEYLTEGVRSLKGIASGSVHFAWSQAVLEHVKRAEFDGLLAELRRVLVSSGVSSHRIDLKDHLSGGLQSLRFSPSFWESRFVAGSGFYTNRLRFSEILDSAARGGFKATVMQRDLFDSFPVPRGAIHPTFRCFSDDDLITSGFDLLLVPI